MNFCLMLQEKQYSELKVEVGKTFQVLQSTLSFMMRKLVNAAHIESDGFVAPSNNLDTDSANAVPSSSLAIQL